MILPKKCNCSNSFLTAKMSKTVFIPTFYMLLLQENSNRGFLKISPDVITF